MGIKLSAPGLVCCAGNNREEFFANALSGDQSGIKPFVTSGGRRFLTGLVDEKNLSLENSAGNRIFRMTASSLEQIKPDVEKAITAYGADRVGVCAGSCDNGSQKSSPAHRSYFTGNGFPSSYSLKEQSASAIAEFIATFFGIKGPCCTIATACASGAGAVVKGAQLIESGICDAVIAGGVDIVSETVLLGFAALEAVSDEICNPFSKNRKGITLGEGAAFFVLEKGAEKTTDIELLGWGESADAYHMTAPRPDGSGAQAAMRSALTMADFSPSDIDYINLHGTGTPLNDIMEAIAMQTVFADNSPPVSSTKPITGHTLGAAGALELALCHTSLAKGGLPAHCWDGQQDEEIPHLNFTSPNTNDKPKICMSKLMSEYPVAAARIIENEELLELMPHRGKMYLISRVVEYDINVRSLRSEYDVSENCLFYDPALGGVPAYACFEFMAQAVSALSGLTGKIFNKPPMMGFILSVSALEIKLPVFKPGDIIQIEVNGQQAVDKVSTFQCVAKVENDEVVKAKLMVMDIENPMEFIGNDSSGK